MFGVSVQMSYRPVRIEQDFDRSPFAVYYTIDKGKRRMLLILI